MKSTLASSGICQDAVSRLAGRGNAKLHPLVTRLAAALLAGAAMLAGSAPAQAQETSDVRLALIGDLSILKTKDLDFGNIIGTVAGTIVMTATTSPTCTASTGLVHGQTCQPAEFLGKGESGRIVRIKKPVSDRIVLTGPGANMNITGLKLDGTPELTLIKATPGYSRYRIASANGIFAFRLAGTLNVGANQTPGEYSGTFNVDINYD